METPETEQPSIDLLAKLLLHRLGGMVQLVRADGQAVRGKKLAITGYLGGGVITLELVDEEPPAC